MSFSFRDRPSLSDRLRGKSGEEIMEELKQAINQDRKKFFEARPKWGQSPTSSSFPTGFPFDDDEDGPGKSKLKEHLDDLAKRHPEFAEQLKGWSDFEKRAKHSDPSNTNIKTDLGKRRKEESGSGHQEVANKAHLRNTVPDMQQSQVAQDEVDRAQRSQSAPPDSQRQFPTKIEVPVDVSSQANQENTKTHQHDQREPEQSHTTTNKVPTVRHIPIHVEGRDEPLLPKEAMSSNNISGCNQYAPRPNKVGEVPDDFSDRSWRPPSYRPQQQPTSIPVQQQKKPGIKVSQDSTEKGGARGKSPNIQQQQSQQSIPIPVQHQQQQVPSSAASSSQSQVSSPQPPPQPPQDPLERVAEIQKEVDSLRQRIEDLKQLTKGDKDYIYLDEMLTRNLLKLDNIETEGKEEVRAARKDVVKRIQDCINILESSPDPSKTT